MRGLPTAPVTTVSWARAKCCRDYPLRQATHQRARNAQENALTRRSPQSTTTEHKATIESTRRAAPSGNQLQQTLECAPAASGLVIYCARQPSVTLKRPLYLAMSARPAPGCGPPQPCVPQPSRADSHISPRTHVIKTVSALYIHARKGVAPSHDGAWHAAAVHAARVSFHRHRLVHVPRNATVNYAAHPPQKLARADSHNGILHNPLPTFCSVLRAGQSHL